MEYKRRWQKFADLLGNGDGQMHTTYTDGKSEPEAYFKQAEENGLSFILFSEHVRRVTTYDYLKFKEHVYRAGARSKVRFAVGAEAKVLDLHGNLDLSDEIARESEMNLFSFHTPAFKTPQEYVQAACAAAANPLADVFAHPTFYHNWQDMKLQQSDWETILLKLKTENVCYEFNKKYPLPGVDELAALKKVGGNFIYGSDAHDSKDLLTQQDIAEFRRLLA